MFREQVWEKYPARFLLGLLNSRLFSYLYAHISRQLGRAFAQVKTTYIKKLLIPKEIKETSIVTLVDQILAAKQKDSAVDTPALERQIDKMVYELYDLTPEEIEIVEGRGMKTVRITVAGVVSVGSPKWKVNIVLDISEGFPKKCRNFSCLFSGKCGYNVTTW